MEILSSLALKAKDFRDKIINDLITRYGNEKLKLELRLVELEGFLEGDDITKKEVFRTPESYGLTYKAWKDNDRDIENFGII